MVGISDSAPAEPELFPDNHDYFSAFFDVATSRPSGFGLASIPVTEIAAYWDRAGVGEFDVFLGRLRAADDAVMKWNRERRKAGRS